MALLKFLARTARTGIVAAHLFLTANHLLHRLHVSSPSHARLFQFATLAAHKSLFQIVSGSRDQSWRMMSVAPTALPGRHSGLRSVACGFASLRTTRAGVRRPLNNLHEVEIARRVFLKALQHVLKHLKRFFLVLDQRIVLAIAA